MFDRRFFLGVLAVGLFVGVADAAEVFTVSATFTNDDFALAELSARIDFCTKSGSEVMRSGTNAAKEDCVKYLISESASCYVQGTLFLCNINGVVLDAADISFQCGSGGCPSADSATVALMDAATNCAPPASVAGFIGSCYTSAYCLEKDLAASTTGFGEYCPSSSGEFCCAADAAIDTSYFPGSEPVLTSDDASYRHIDHVVDMDFSIAYDVSAPANLQLKVTVPYVTSATTMTFVSEGGNNVTRTMCPTTYLIDFVPPVETEPRTGDGVIDPPPSRVGAWLPLTHFPAQDLLGRPRTSCAAYDMQYADEAAFNTGFLYPTGGASDFTYGNVLATDAANWDTSAGTTGIPFGSTTFWNKGSAPGAGAPQTITYTVGDSPTGHFDLVRVWTQCKNLKTNDQVVVKDADTDDVIINGVSYPVESYSWALSVCAVGWYGQNCDAQMYAKTCRSIPASVSVTAQQIAHVTVTPITSQLVSKTFLQSVDAFEGDCSPLSERVAVTLNLVIFGTDYEIKSAQVHDILKPTGILDSANQEDLVMTEVSGYTTFMAYVEAGNSPTSGIYVLDKRTVSSGSTTVYYRKVVVVTKCYQTNLNPTTGTRDAPSVFANAIAGSDTHVMFDVEVILTDSNTDTVNTLNLRILATKDTFVLPSTSLLKQKDASAYQALYGSYASAVADTALTLPNKLPVPTTMRGGDQMCSKHQLVEADAQSVNLIPNAVGSCMIKTTIPAAFANKAGTTIQYKVPGGEVTKYTYGCFPDWIDTTTATPNGEGVYEFSGPVVRQNAGEIHDSIFWFVQKQALEETKLVAGELMKDRFGTALFWYDMDANSYVTTTSSQFQTELSSFAAVNPSGCVNQLGAQKSSCNLVCFDIVDGLLTDPDGQTSRQMLVHHVSVATIANSSHTEAVDKLPGPAKHRRMLLESVTSTVRAAESLSDGITTVKVLPGPNQEVVSNNNTARRDYDGPKYFAPIFFPIMFTFIFSFIGIIGCICIRTRFGKNVYDKIGAGSMRSYPVKTPRDTMRDSLLRNRM